MSNYLIHSGMFDRNQFGVLFDWFDFIHRCFSHSRWPGPNQPLCVIPSLDLHIHSISFHFIQWSLNIQCLLCLFVPNPLPPFPGHWFRIQSSIDSFPSFHHNPDWCSQHVPILCVIDVKNENKELTKSSLIQCSK